MTLSKATVQDTVAGRKISRYLTWARWCEARVVTPHVWTWLILTTQERSQTITEKCLSVITLKRGHLDMEVARKDWGRVRVAVLLNRMARNETLWLRSKIDTRSAWRMLYLKTSWKRLSLPTSGSSSLALALKTFNLLGSDETREKAAWVVRSRLALLIRGTIEAVVSLALI